MPPGSVASINNVFKLIMYSEPYVYPDCVSIQTLLNVQTLLPPPLMTPAEFGVGNLPGCMPGLKLFSLIYFHHFNSFIMTPAEKALFDKVTSFMGIKDPKEFKKVAIVEQTCSQQIIDAHEATKSKTIEVVLTQRTSDPAGNGFYYDFEGRGGVKGNCFVSGTTDQTGNFITVYLIPKDSLKPVTRKVGGVDEHMTDVVLKQLIDDYKAVGKSSATSQAAKRITAREAMLSLTVLETEATQRIANLARLEKAIVDGNVEVRTETIEELADRMGLKIKQGVSI
jgi:hypothetical protein